MKTYLELGEISIEVDLRTDWHAFSEDEQRRQQLWSLGAQLVAWIGLTSVLVAVLVFSFFWSVGS